MKYKSMTEGYQPTVGADYVPPTPPSGGSSIMRPTAQTLDCVWLIERIEKKIREMEGQ